MRRRRKKAEIVNANNFIEMKRLILAFSQYAQILAAFSSCIAWKVVSANAKQFDTKNNNHDMRELNKTKSKNDQELKFCRNKSDKIAV